MSWQKIWYQLPHKSHCTPCWDSFTSRLHAGFPGPPEQMQEPHPTFDASTVGEMLVPTSIGSRPIVAATAPWLWLVEESWWVGIAPWDWELGGEWFTGISVTGMHTSHQTQAKQTGKTGSASKEHRLFSSGRAGTPWTGSKAVGEQSQQQLTSGFRCSCFMLMQYEYLQEWQQVMFKLIFFTWSSGIPVLCCTPGRYPNKWWKNIATLAQTVDMWCYLTFT